MAATRGLRQAYQDCRKPKAACFRSTAAGSIRRCADGWLPRRNISCWKCCRRA